MPLLKAGRFVADDWLTLADDEAVPAGGPASSCPWRGCWPRPRRSTASRAIWASGSSPASGSSRSSPGCDRLALVALSFPSFADGRAFSTARILRERYGFAGEIRAVGDVQIDRYQFMRQCGFDAFEISPERAHEQVGPGRDRDEPDLPARLCRAARRRGGLAGAPRRSRRWRPNRLGRTQPGRTRRGLRPTGIRPPATAPREKAKYLAAILS